MRTLVNWAGLIVALSIFPVVLTLVTACGSGQVSGTVQVKEYEEAWTEHYTDCGFHMDPVSGESTYQCYPQTRRHPECWRLVVQPDGGGAFAMCVSADEWGGVDIGEWYMSREAREEQEQRQEGSE